MGAGDDVSDRSESFSCKFYKIIKPTLMLSGLLGARNRSLGFEVKLAFGSGKGGGKWLTFKLGVSAGAEVTTDRPVGLDAGTPGLFRHCRRGVGAD